MVDIYQVSQPGPLVAAIKCQCVLSLAAEEKTSLGEHGTGGRGQVTGNRGQGTGDRGQGTGGRGQGTGDRRQVFITHRLYCAFAVFSRFVLVEEKPCDGHRPLGEDLQRGHGVIPDGDVDRLAGRIEPLPEE